MQQFFIADTHFGHENIVKFQNRPFTSANMMDSTLIHNWNQTVSKEDKIFILGDFAFAAKERVKELVEILNGYKILVLGNHDLSRSYTWWKSLAFEEISRYPIVLPDYCLNNLTRLRNRIFLSHEPMHLSAARLCMNIHGHVHSSMPFLYKQAGESISVNVSMDVIKYAPISLTAIMQAIKTEWELFVSKSISFEEFMAVKNWGLDYKK